jgi:hypothetical protein
MISRERKTRSAILKGSFNAGITLDMLVNFLFSVLPKTLHPEPGKIKTSSSLLSTADKVNNLQPIFFTEDRRSPVVPAHNFTVELDCNSRRRQ